MLAAGADRTSAIAADGHLSSGRALDQDLLRIGRALISLHFRRNRVAAIGVSKHAPLLAIDPTRSERVGADMQQYVVLVVAHRLESFRRDARRKGRAPQRGPAAPRYCEGGRENAISSRLVGVLCTRKAAIGAVLRSNCRKQQRPRPPNARLGRRREPVESRRRSF